MANIADLKLKIGSVQSTAKTTRAMQLVSAVKMKKMQDNYQNGQFYLQGLKDVLAHLASTKSEISLPLLRQPEKEKQALIIVVGTSRGFVGSQLSRLGMKTWELTEELKSKGVSYEVVSVKNRTMKLLARYGLTANYHFGDHFESLDPQSIVPLKELIIDGFVSDKYQSVYIVFSQFVSTLTQEAVIDQMLPLKIDDIMSVSEDKPVKDENADLEGSYTFEPDAETILERLLGEYLEINIYNALLSANASEYSARMVAMQQATNNANELVGKLQIEFNKTRQTLITQQLQENINANLILDK
jgi:F-type H+-transporting ATPase subunit gamma